MKRCITSAMVSMVVLVLAMARNAECSESNEAYRIRIVSTGAGSWGKGGFAYDGVVIIRKAGFDISITSVENKRSRDSGGGLAPKPFEGAVDIGSTGVLEIEIRARGNALDRQALGKAYNLVYLVSENVFYQFFDGKWETEDVIDGEGGRVLLRARRPTEIRSKHFGSLPARQYSVGPVRADSFVVLPGIDGKSEGMTIGLFRRQGLNTEVHLRAIPAGARFPSRTRILSVSRKTDVAEKGIQRVLEAQDDEDYAASFNRVDISLEPMTIKK